MLVVADTSSLLALAACDGLPLLDTIFGEIRVPPGVFAESTVAGRPYSEELRGYLTSKVVQVDLGEVVIAAGGLGAGELEAMALYKRLHADRLLIDDHRARRVFADAIVEIDFNLAREGVDTLQEVRLDPGKHADRIPNKQRLVRQGPHNSGRSDS